VGDFQPCRACEKPIALDLDFCPHCRVSTDPSVPFDASAVDAAQNDWGGLLSYLGEPSEHTRTEPDWETMEEALADGRATPPVVSTFEPKPILGPLEGFKDTRSYAGATRVLMALWVLISGVLIGHNLTEIRILNRLEVNVGQISLDQYESSQLRLTQIRFLLIGGLVVSGILFGAWLYRSYRNLDKFGYQRRFKTSSAWYGLFIPILNMFRPRQIIGEIWMVTRGEGRSKSVGVLDAWWGVWIVAVYFGFIQAVFIPVEADSIRSALVLRVARFALLGVAAVLAFVVVGQTSHRLEEAAGYEMKEPRFEPRLVQVGLAVAGVAVAVVAFMAFDSPSVGVEVEYADGAYDAYGMSFPLPDDASVIEKGTISEDVGDSFGIVVAQAKDFSKIQTVEWMAFGDFSERELLDLVDEILGMMSVELGDADFRPSEGDPIAGRPTAIASATVAEGSDRFGVAVAATSCDSDRTVVVTVMEIGETGLIAKRSAASVLEDLTC